MAAAAGVIDEEVRRFAALGDEWWNPAGPMAALHRLNPTRLAWMRETIARHFGRDAKGAAPPLAGLTLLDVGCGGGLVAEPLARMGADVVGLDPAAGIDRRRARPRRGDRRASSPIAPDWSRTSSPRARASTW